MSYQFSILLLRSAITVPPVEMEHLRSSTLNRLFSQDLAVSDRLNFRSLRPSVRFCHLIEIGSEGFLKGSNRKRSYNDLRGRT